jgi:hypothetical protein
MVERTFVGIAEGMLQRLYFESGQCRSIHARSPSPLQDRRTGTPLVNTPAG